jgi:hypothetical protein
VCSVNVGVVETSQISTAAGFWQNVRFVISVTLTKISQKPAVMGFQQVSVAHPLTDNAVFFKVNF